MAFSASSPVNGDYGQSGFVEASQQRITLTDVEKSFGDAKAVKGISFEVEPGEFVILLGPSGCGKSTTLRMIAGLEQATAGSIAIGAKDVTFLPPGDRGLSMVFQTYALFPHLTVAGNIEFGLKSRKVPKPEREKRLRTVAELVGLTDYLDRKPAQLSGGQRQRVALARAVISENPICLMDEPLSNLDARLRGDMRREIKSLQKRLNMTVIYVTHDQVEAMSMGDRIILMKDGVIIQDGTPDQLYNRPATDFVASFIGSPAMNILQLTGSDSGACIAGDDTPVAEPEAAGCRLGIRPEDMFIAERLPGGVPARILNQEYLGSDTVVHVLIGEQEAFVKTSGKVIHDTASEIRVGWHAADTHVFSGTGGARLQGMAVYDMTVGNTAKKSGEHQ